MKAARRWARACGERGSKAQQHGSDWSARGGWGCGGALARRGVGSEGGTRVDGPPLAKTRSAETRRRGRRRTNPFQGQRGERRRPPRAAARAPRARALARSRVGDSRLSHKTPASISSSRVHISLYISCVWYPLGYLFCQNIWTPSPPLIDGACADGADGGAGALTVGAREPPSGAARPPQRRAGGRRRGEESRGAPGPAARGAGPGPPLDGCARRGAAGRGAGI